MIDEATITAIVVIAQRKTKCFIRRSYRDSIVANASEKLLANRPTRQKGSTTAKAKPSMPPEAGQTEEPLDEQIRMRAYFISERRRRFALPGDADSDWLEAKRQLLSESPRR